VKDVEPFTVEVVLVCIACKKNFTKVFTDPVNWADINAEVARKDPRCPDCPQFFDCYYDD
jgi:hypothetical protein